MKKRVLAVLLMVCMLLSMVPTVHAASSSEAHNVYIATLTAGGNPVADKPTAKAGETVTITLNEEPDYVLDVWSYTGPSGVEQTLETITFVMPDGDVWFEFGFRSIAPKSSIDVFVFLNGLHTGETVGTVSFSTLEPSANEEVTVGVYPAEGYALEGYTCMATTKSVYWSGGEIREEIYSQLDFCSGNESSFIMPCAAALTFVFSFVPVSGVIDPSTPDDSAENPFTDVAEGRFYYEPVMWAVDEGITTGATDTTFAPDQECTRGQVVTFLWRAAGSPEPTTTECAFTDVNPNAFYYKAMLWAVEKGITNGTSATEFSPNAECTRGQVVTFLWRAKGSTAPEETDHSFTDVKSGAFYYNAMLWAVEKGITNGKSATTFEPGSTCSRGEVVTFLYRAYAE